VTVSSRRSRLIGVLIAAAAALVMIAAPAAQATFPGPNGRIAFVDFNSEQVYAVNPDGSALVQLTHTDPGRATDHPSWSADSEQLLFTLFRSNRADDHARIWIMDADGSNAHQVATDRPGFRDYGPKFTPDGTHIVFARCRPNDGVCAIWKMRSDGTGKQPLTPFVDDGTNEHVDFAPSVSPDGESIAFGRFFGEGFNGRLFVMNSDGSDPHPITPPRLEAFGPDWSPDGERLVFADKAPRTGSTLFTIGADGTDLEQLTPRNYPFNDIFGAYAPRGNRIAFVSDRNYPDGCCLDLFSVNVGGGPGQLIDTGLSPPGILVPAWGSAPLLP
jgi:Tol biopolymer transport system component